MASTAVADIIVPEVFSPYVQQLTAEKSRLVQSGILSIDPRISQELGGGGLTFNIPSFNDLTNEDEDIASATVATTSTPSNIETLQEIQVRMSRNKSWGSADLAADLAGADPMQAIGSRVSYYWTRRLQAAFIACVKGLFANNTATTDAYHTKDDMIYDASGSVYSAGVTDFQAENFTLACLTMGDSMEEIRLIMVHSVVYSRMLRNNLIDFIPDSTNPHAAAIPTYLGRIVVVDDSVPFSASVSVYESWLFGIECFGFGSQPPRVPVAVERNENAGNGSGEEILYTRNQWCIHPRGFAYVGTSPSGGPSNAATTNNLAVATSWRRVFTERKQVRIAKLITREA